MEIFGKLILFVFVIISSSSSLLSSIGAKRLNIYESNQLIHQHTQQSKEEQKQLNLLRQSVTSRETKSCRDRETSGTICETCELLSTCVHTSNGWMNIPVETCDIQNGYYCNSRLGECSNSTGPCHPFGFEGFQCTSQGIFPDPYDCQKYHVCHYIGATLVAAAVECVGDKAFNAATGQCSLTLDHPVCQKKQFECLHVGDAQPWPSNPNIFYICKATSNQEERVLYPSLYRCSDGEIFDGYFCKAGANTPVFPTIEPTINPNDPSTSTMEPSPQRCNMVGLTPDPENCHRYFYCSGVNGNLRHLECPAGTYYNEILSSCTLGSC